MTSRRLPAFTLLLSCVCTWGCDPAATGADRPQAGNSGDALRIVSLSPHLAELAFAVGAGDLLVGVSAYTDYPEGAAALPVIGDAFAVDQEQLALLQPDLLLAWESGTPSHVVDELRLQGFRVETIRTRGIGDVADALETLGGLTGRVEEAQEAAKAFRDGMRTLAERHAGVEPLRVFYQIQSRPLYTINGNHFVSELIAHCGGVNIFADLSGLAPLVSVEAVLERDPEVLLASDDNQDDTFDEWRRWADLAANRYGNRFLIPAAEIGRATPRLLLAGDALCRALDRARRNRARARGDG